MRNFSTLLVPSKFDWRDKNVVTKVKEQGSCGSCWTFSTAAAMESYNAIAGGDLYNMSPQQILDCSNDYGINNGC